MSRLLEKIHNSENKFLILLITLISLMLFLALPSLSRVGEIIQTGLITLIVLAGIYVASNQKKYFYIASITGTLAIVLNWLGVFRVNTLIENYWNFHPFYLIYAIDLLKICNYMFFFVLVTIRLIGMIAQHRRVTADVIYGSISGYLLLGLTSALLLTAIEYLMPNSFAMNIEVNGQEELFRSLFYYSFVTLATIGYGDITPISPLARTLSITLGITGQMYLTILIAILVSKYLNSQRLD